jgi:hypothetical protein
MIGYWAGCRYDIPIISLLPERVFDYQYSPLDLRNERGTKLV